MKATATREHPPALHVEVHGDHGDPLILLHGFGATGFTWRYWIRGLARDRRVYVVDLKGFGRSPKPRDGRYSPHDHADAVCRMVEDHGLERFTLIGHSLGGGVALLTALRMLDAGQSDRVKALVLVASAAVPQNLPRFIGLARLPVFGVATLGSVPPRHLVRWVLRQIVHDRSVVAGDWVDGYAMPLATPDARYGVLATARAIIPPDVDEIVRRFPELRIPALLLWGRHDRVVPLWVGERLAAGLPQARLEVLEDCGHMPPEELPAESLALVTRFLEGVEAAP